MRTYQFMTLFKCWILLMLAAPAKATTTTIWSGQKTFTNWGDVVNVDGSKFSSVQPDDVVRFVIQASSGAQLQVSYGSSWTNFDGLSAMSISGNYEMVVSTAMVSQLKQGIHVKGVNYTLSAIVLVTGNEPYTTECESLFAWDDLHVSGVTKGKYSGLGFKDYSGAGWYWAEGTDLGQYRFLDIQMQQPLSSMLIIQVLDDVAGARSINVAAGNEKYRLTLPTNFNHVYSVCFLSQKSQNVSLGSVNLIDRQGNIVTTGIRQVENDLYHDDSVVSREYLNAAGQYLDAPQKGLNIVRLKLKNGKEIVRKFILR